MATVAKEGVGDLTDAMATEEKVCCKIREAVEQVKNGQRVKTVERARPAKDENASSADVGSTY